MVRRTRAKRYSSKGPKEGDPTLSDLETETEYAARLRAETQSRKRSMARLHSILSGQGRVTKPRQRLRPTLSGSSRTHSYGLEPDSTATLGSYAPRPIETFRFQSLPAELRLLVYNELLVSDDYLLITWRGPRKSFKHQKEIHPAVLRACKDVYKEGISVLYGENVFNFEEIMRSPSCGPSFLQTIGPYNASSIRLIVAEYSPMIEEFHALQSQYLNIPHIRTFLSTFGIELDRLFMLAVSIRPFDTDDAVQLKRNSVIVGAKEQWVNTKNAEIESVVERVVERERDFVRAEMGDVDKRLCFDWITPWRPRNWLLYSKHG